MDMGPGAIPMSATFARDNVSLHPPVHMPLLRWTFGLLNRLVMLGDGAVIVLSSLVLVFGRDGTIMPISAMQALLLAVLEAAVFILVLKRLRRYRFESYERPAISVPGLIPGLIAAWSVGTLYFVTFERFGTSVGDLYLYWHVPQAVCLVLARFGSWELARQVHRRGMIRRTVVIIGANASGEAILARLQSPEQKSRYEVVHIFADIFDEHQSGTLSGVPISNDINRLGTYAQSHVVDLVIVALPVDRAIKSVTMIEDLHWIAADVVIPLDELGLHPSFARLSTIAGTATLQVLDRPLKGLLALVKMAEDYIVAAAAMLVAAPIMVLVALAIRLDSKGPIFFMQERTGFNTNSFWIYKFRTMTVDLTDDGSSGTMTRDNPRITRVGRILRRLSIDELPQLINVLQGNMSIVGPRPYVPNMLIGSEQFRDAVRNCAYRYRLKPGITGLAQASGMRSNALRSMSNAEISVEMDMKYIMTWSIWLDFQIMLRTVLVAMSGPEVF